MGRSAFATRGEVAAEMNSTEAPRAIEVAFGGATIWPDRRNRCGAIQFEDSLRAGTDRRIVEEAAAADLHLPVGGGQVWRLER